MNHDSFCPVTWHEDAHWDWSYHCDDECDDIECRCEEIAKIRANEREKILAGVLMTECSMHDYENSICHLSIDQLTDMLETTYPQ
jgi:hypothetical protein